MTNAITEKTITQYESYLRGEERASGTIEKYARDIRSLAAYLDGQPPTKELAVGWKDSLRATHAATSANSMLAAANGLFSYLGLSIRLKPIKIQRGGFLPPGGELMREEYERLLAAAKSAGNERLYHIMQTLCATGLRVSELAHIDVAAVMAGRAEVTNKGKARTVLLPQDLRAGLLGYIERRGTKSGPVFATRGGKPVDRSNIWAEMKRLCEAAGVERGKVYPHSLRSLFSRMVHGVDGDMALLADILGHSDINTTRLYVRESTARYRRIIDGLGLARMRYTANTT